MSKFLRKAVFLLFALPLLYFSIQSLYSLINKAYFIDENKLYKLNTFHLYDRAYQTSYGGGKKYGGGRKYESQLQFQSTDGYSFAIQGNFFESVQNRKQLKDALLCDDNAFVPNTTLHHDITFIPYTSKQYYEEYKSTPYPVFIKVYQIQIGDKKYIDINEANARNKSSLVRHTIVPVIFLLMIILIIAIRPIKQKVSKFLKGPAF